MKNKKVYEAWNQVKMSKEEKNAMFKNIVNEVAKRKQFEASSCAWATTAPMQTEKLSSPPQQRSKKNFPWKRSFALAAGICIVLVIGLLFTHWYQGHKQAPLLQKRPPSSKLESSAPAVIKKEKYSPAEDLEKLKIRFDSGFGIGMGVGPTYYAEVEEISPYNLIDEGIIPTHLPVYKNRDFHIEALLKPRNWPEEEMRQKLESIAEEYGIQISEFLPYPSEKQKEELLAKHDKFTNFPEYELETSVLYAVGDRYDLCIWPNRNTWYLFFKEPVNLPENAHLGAGAYNIEEDLDIQKERVSLANNFLFEKYSDLFHFKNPGKSSGKITYYYDGAITYESENYFDIKEDDPCEITVNYCFKQAKFIDFTYGLMPKIPIEGKGNSKENTAVDPDSSGSCSGIEFSLYDLSNLVGDYPIISPEEAQERLLKGYYLTNSENVEEINMENVTSRGLVYHMSSLDEQYVPYYLFYIEDPNAKELSTADGVPLKGYRPFYVSAIQPQWLDPQNPDEKEFFLGE